MHDLPSLCRTTHRPRHGLPWGIAAIALAALTACGGGGSDDSSTDPTPTPTPEVRYAVGGQLVGLASGQTVVVRNAATAEDLTLHTNGPFTFIATVPSGGAYDVAVQNQPQGQTCVVNEGSGTAASDVGNVVVTCGSTPAPTPATANWIRDLAGACVDVPRTFDGYVSTTDGRQIEDYGNTLTNTQGVFFFTGNGCTGQWVFKPSTTVWQQQVRARYTSAQGMPIRRVTSTAPSVGTTIDEVWWEPPGNLLCVMADSPSESNERMAELISFTQQIGCFRRFP